MYHNDEDDSDKITPYNAFEILEACRAGVALLDEKVMLSWDNLADLNARMEMSGRYFNHLTQQIRELKQENTNLHIEIQGLKQHIFPLLESVNQQLKILVKQTGEQE